MLMLAGVGLLPLAAAGQTAADTTSTKLKDQTLSGVTIVSHQTTRRSPGAVNATSLLRSELFKAACCNLGESFTNNPSVDVNYSDAATGARQIKLLGLAGKYVQMLTENLPDFRGASMPYGLSYVPGSWMNSIQVSTGNASVKNGYESMTGQINVEYLKPEAETGGTISLYGNTMSRFEADAEGNIHVADGLSTEIMGHFENNWGHHDGNGDNFQDTPNIRQYNFQNRWYWKTGHYLFHGGIGLLTEDRGSGQTFDRYYTGSPLYRINISTDRYTAYMKHAYIFGDSHNSNIALMGNVSMHKENAVYGSPNYYDVNEKNAYASLMFESDITPENKISVGLSFNHDYLHQGYMKHYHEDNSVPYFLPATLIESETTPGAYAQYTFNRNNKFIAMAGLRVDHSNVYGTFWTPRFHLKWVAADWLTMRASAGLGYRSPFALAEYNYLMASNRRIVMNEKLDQEKAWNYGFTANFYIPVGRRTLKLNAQYYYTRFINETVVDRDTRGDIIFIGNLHGLSYSHTFQADANIDIIDGLNISAAYRYNLVKSTYNGKRLWKPLQSRYKALFSASYKPGMGLWQFDLTFALNGGGRMPNPSWANDKVAWSPNFKAYPMLNLQVKRSFRHFDIYVGGENLTNYKQKNPIISADNPWNSDFDPTMIYGPVTGAMGYVSVRIKLGSRLL